MVITPASTARLIPLVPVCVRGNIHPQIFGRLSQLFPASPLL
jgi:hypothetical protein